MKLDELEESAYYILEEDGTDLSIVEVTTDFYGQGKHMFQICGRDDYYKNSDGVFYGPIELGQLLLDLQ